MVKIYIQHIYLCIVCITRMCVETMNVKKQWVPLHVHTVYSNFDGAISVPNLFDWAENHEVEAFGITDHGIMSGIPQADAVSEKKTSTRPIYGCELYMDPVIHAHVPSRPSHHLLALAMNKTGYHNLLKLLSFAHKDNFYRKPRVTLEAIKTYGQGIVFSSACISGELPSLLLNKERDNARKFVREMLEATQGNFCIELVDTGDKDIRQMAMNKELYNLAHEMNVRPILTCDSHYFAEDAKYHSHILAVSQKKSLSEFLQSGMDMSLFDLSLRTPEEMWNRWGHVYPDALLNTVEIAKESEHFSIVPETYQMPQVEQDVVSLPEIARSGLREKLDARGISGARKSTYEDRLEMEMKTVHSMGFDDYFLMVHEMVHWAKNSGIFVGPGRGSAAGSLLAWSLGITSVDPIRHNLFFERFLNPERVSMPDIDVDFEDTRRGEVIEHLKDRYGEKAVCGIIGYSEAHWKGSLRDAAKTLSYGSGKDELGDVFASAVSDYIDAECLDKGGVPVSEIPSLLTDEAIRVNPKLKNSKDKMLEIAFLASKFISLVRHYTKHASGVVIATPDVTDHCPLYNLKGSMVVQYDMEGVERVKLIKMDILGLSNLSMLRSTYEASVRYDPSTPSPEALYTFLDTSGENLVDSASSGIVPGITSQNMQKTIDILGQGDTTGVFQLFSRGMRKLLRSIKPSDIDALCALIALYRPGPLASGMTSAYVAECKGDGQESPFPHSVIAPISDITKDSRGMIIYQEQVMQTARVLGGYSLGEADLLRRAMGKKKPEVMQTEKKRFVRQCIEHGLTEEAASQTFDTLAHFAGYGFNKSHSTAYAYLAFITAWYKANREPAFWAAFLDTKNEQEKKDDMYEYIREVMQKWHVFQPEISPDDSSLMDIYKSQIVRLGKDIGEIIDGQDAIDMMWEIPDRWRIHLGLPFIKGISQKTASGLEDFPYPENIQDMFHILSSPDSDSKWNAKNVGRLMLAGVFDNAILKTLKDLKSYCTLPVFRSLLISFDTVMDTHPELSELILSLVEELSPSRTLTPLKKLKNADRQRWLGFMHLFTSRIGIKVQAKRNRWDAEKVQEVFQRLNEIIALIASIGEEEEIKAFQDESMRLQILQSLYCYEKIEMGESCSVPSWVMASEMVGWSMAGYIDEIYAFIRQAKRGNRDFPWTHPMKNGEGAWFIGFAENIFTSRQKERFLVLSGRWGTSTGVYFARIPKEFQGIPRFTKGECCAVKLKIDNDGRGFIVDFCLLPLLLPISKITFLPSTKLLIRIPEAPHMVDKQKTDSEIACFLARVAQKRGYDSIAYAMNMPREFRQYTSEIKVLRKRIGKKEK